MSVCFPVCNYLSFPCANRSAASVCPVASRALATVPESRYCVGAPAHEMPRRKRGATKAGTSHEERFAPVAVDPRPLRARRERPGSGVIEQFEGRPGMGLQPFEQRIAEG